MAQSFRMHIKDIFHFRDGRTVLAGPVEGEIRLLQPGRCEVWVNGTRLASIQIEGEMIACGAHPHEAGCERSVSTLETTHLTRELVAGGQCVLKSVD